MAARFLPYGRQSIGEDDIAAVTRVLRGDYLTTGLEIPAFEAELAAATDAPHAVACSSGTAALHLALAALDVGPGDVCIVPAITFMATANAARYCGADVVFADVDPSAGLMTPDTLADALARAGGAAKAVLPVHLAGRACDMPAIADLAGKAGAAVVEDACHAIGTITPDGPVGNCAHSAAACFSFHPVKTIASGEGGAVTTQDGNLAERMARLRAHGIERDPAKFEGDADEPWRHEMTELGWNYRMTDIHAALGRSQLAKLPAFAARRRELAAFYDKSLVGLTPHVRTVPAIAGCEPCLHLYVALVDFAAIGTTRPALMRALAQRGVGSQVHYMPVPTQPYYRRLYGDQLLTGAARYYERCLSLPLYVGMEDSDPAYVAAALKEVLGV